MEPIEPQPSSGNRGSRARLATALLLTQVFLGTRATVAAAQPAGPCSSLKPRIVVADRLPPTWAEALRRTCEGLLGSQELDPTIVLHVWSQGEGLELTAVLPDGRSTMRSVRTPDELPTTVGALVTTLPASPRTVAAPEPAKAAPPSNKPGSPAIDRRPLDIEVGATVAGRIAGNPTSFAPSIGGYAGLLSAKWLLAMAVRWDLTQIMLQSADSSLEMDAAGAGFVLARRFAGRSVQIDGGLTASLLVEAQSIEAADGERAGSEADVHLGLMSRALFGYGHPRWTVSLEGDVAPARLRRKLHIDPSLPTLPAWQLGLGLGASWSVL